MIRAESTKKIFFITNMYAKANQRSAIEDSLKDETGIDVRIFDVSWILDQIFSNGYEQLAIDTLSIETEWSRRKELGSNDYARTLRLNELKARINTEIDESKILFHQLHWLLEAAILSKELENPPFETKGLFDRAVAASKKYGNSHHQFEAHYHYAWAAYWWLEDMDLFRIHLGFCFEMAIEIGNSGQWGRTVSLLGLYSSHCRRIGDDEALTDYETLATKSRSNLLKLALQDERPSNSIMSKAYIELLDLQTIKSTDCASVIFSSLLEIVKEGEALVGFPFN